MRPMCSAPTRGWSAARARAGPTPITTPWSAIRAFSEAVDWLYDPRNRDEAVLIFRKNLPNVPEQGAQAAYGVLLAPSGGFQKKAQIDLEGVRTVLALRSKYAEPKRSLTDPNKYYDPSFYRAAMR